MITCSRVFNICAGHRVYGHEGKCRMLHGHNYRIEITAEARGLDDLGRVIDFGELKSRFGEELERNWDHIMILWEKDTEAIELCQKLHGQRILVLPYNPTAENIASALLNVVGPQTMAGTGIKITKVRVWETVNCYAEAILS